MKSPGATISGLMRPSNVGPVCVGREEGWGEEGGVGREEWGGGVLMIVWTIDDVADRAS